MANWTIKETALEMGLKDPTVRKLVARRLLPHVRLGRAIRVPSDAVRDYILRNTIPALNSKVGGRVSKAQ